MTSQELIFELNSRVKPRRRFISIRRRLVFSFLLIAGIPLALAALAASVMVTRATEASSINLLTTVLGYKERGLQNLIDELGDILHTQSILDTEQITVASLLDPSAKSNEWMNSYTLHTKTLNQKADGGQPFDVIAVIDPQGKVLYSDHTSLSGKELRDEVFFQDALNGNRQYLGDLHTLGNKYLILTEPVKFNQSQLVGFVSGVVNLKRVEDILVQGENFGDTVETYLVGSDYNLITSPNPNSGVGEHPKIYTKGSINAILGNQTGAGSYENYLGQDVIGAYRWIPELRSAIFVEQNRGEIFAPTIKFLWMGGAILLLVIVITSLISWYIANSIGTPIQRLAQTAQQISAGDVSLEATVDDRADEVSVLAESFNDMTRQLRNNINELEIRVAERTSDLESLTAQQLLASQLSSKVTSILDIKELFQQAVNLIKDGFDLYYVGLFQVDETNTWAVLKAGTDKEGEAMLSRGHRIKLGEGMIGWCIQNGKPRIALQAGEDPIRLATPDLPETRSEVAIPLRSRGLVIGALTIQSTHPNSFNEASLNTFQTMADQIAVAIDNAKLFTEAENSLAATQRAYGELSQKAWIDQLKATPIFATRSEQGLIVSRAETNTNGFSSKLTDEGNKSNGVVVIPIKVRGTLIGKLEAKKLESDATWTNEDHEILNTLTDQLGIALESARLFEETRTRAERERLIGEITNRVRETLDVETILRTATIEIQKAFELDEAEVRLSQTVTQVQGHDIR